VLRVLLDYRDRELGFVVSTDQFHRVLANVFDRFSDHDHRFIDVNPLLLRGRGNVLRAHCLEEMSKVIRLSSYREGLLL